MEKGKWEKKDLVIMTHLYASILHVPGLSLYGTGPSLMALSSAASVTLLFIVMNPVKE